MAIKFESIQPGETLLDVHSERAGNTMLRRLGVWKVRIVSVDYEDGTALVKWNGNPPQTWDRRRLSKLRRFAPEWLPPLFTRSDARFYCHHCHATSAEKNPANHKPDCPHPKAVAYRKKNGAK